MVDINDCLVRYIRSSKLSTLWRMTLECSVSLTFGEQGVPRPFNHTFPQQSDHPMTYFWTATVILLLLRDHIKLQEQIDEGSGARVRTARTTVARTSPNCDTESPTHEYVSLFLVTR